MLTLAEFPEQILAALGTVRRLDFPPQGDTSDVAVVDSTAGLFVVKRSRGTQFSAWVTREHQVLLALAETSLPVPRPHQFSTRMSDGEPEAWLLMDYLPGEPVRAVLTREHDRAARDRLLHNWARVLAAFHATPPPSTLTLTTDLWLDEMLRRAAYNLQHFPVDGDSTLLRRLQQNRPAPLPETLIHGDFTVDNTLVANGVVVGVIDWSGGAIGDPRYDLTLAIREKSSIFDDRDAAIFLEAYGHAHLTAHEIEYFEGLYEFF